MTLHPLLAASIALVLVGSAPARADSDRHGPASPGGFPSHRFRRAARQPSAQLAFHYGLLQPLLTRGFNAAVDVRIGRLVLSYSHGQGLEISRAPGTLTAEEKDAGMRLVMPYSTGAGIGITLVDELYVMADFKLHRFEAHAGAENARYSTATIGAEIGWRFFLWKGLHVTPVLRYWPNVWDNAPAGGTIVETRTGTLTHAPAKQGASGLFANILIGWAFDVGGGGH